MKFSEREKKRVYLLIFTIEDRFREFILQTTILLDVRKHNKNFLFIKHIYLYVISNAL